MQKKIFLSLCLLSVVVPVTLAIGSTEVGPRTPVILSASEEGGILIIRGANLSAAPGVEPFVTLSGTPLAVSPGFTEFELRAELPPVERGSYLLTVAADRSAAQAGVLAVTLGKRAERRQAAADAVVICANRRHMRVAESEAECKRNETVLTLQAAESPEPVDDIEPDDDSDGDSDSDSDGDSDSESDDDSDGDSDADSDADSDSGDSGRGNDKGKGKGKGNGNGRGNGDDADSDSDSDD